MMNRNKIIIVVTALLFVFPGICYGVGEITIKAGTPIAVKLLDTVNAETATAGQTVRAEVTKDVKVDDVTVIKAGTEVVVEIAYAQKPGTFGKEGKINLVVRHTTAVDGTKVPLRSSLEQTGEEKMALSFLLCPFIKGSSATVNAGTETKTYVDYDTKIRI